MPYKSSLHCILLLVLVGCTMNVPTRFYLLDSRAEAVSGDTAAETVLGLEPIVLPEYLDRPDIVTRTTEHRLNLASFDRWAEPLDRNAARVLADGIDALLPATRVVSLADRAVETDLNLRFDIDRFEQQPNGEVLLAGSWMVEDPASRASVIARSVSIREEVSGDGYDAIADAMSRALDRLSQRIAAEITSAGLAA